MNNQSQKWGHKSCLALVVVMVITTTSLIYSFTVNSYAGPFYKKQKQPEANQSEGALPTVRNNVKYVDLSGVVSILEPDKVLNKRYDDCAIISSSGHMSKSKAGPDIDKSSCVFRMNNGPVRGFEADVGHRTTVRVIAHSAVRDVTDSKTQLLLGSARPEICVIWGPEYSMKEEGGIAYKGAAALAKEFKDIEFYMLTQKQMNRTDLTYEIETGKPRQDTGSWLSTGWFTMIMAVNMCNSIRVYGMVEEDHCRRNPNSAVPYHYYEPTGLKECTLYNRMEAASKNRHRFALEKSIFAKWAPIYNITFHYPEWENPSSAAGGVDTNR